MEALADHKIGTLEEHRAARDELLKREKELTRANDELARQRRELPWGRSRRTTPSRPTRDRRRSRNSSTGARS